MIEISHLTKKYAANTAVYDLNLKLEPGHIYGFLGPNGAGKSTTMNIITGYIGASSGEVKVNGFDINQEPEKAKACIGYLPEQPPLYGDMKVREYLKFAAGLKGIKKEDTDEAIRQVINKTKLYQVENRLIRNLSKGFRQRVGLAQALLGAPEIIILDEPTVGLDPKQIIEIRALIKSLKKDHTVVLSSHIMQEISAVCDHVFIINNGKIVANDTMENLEYSMSGAQRVEVTIFGQSADAEALADVPGAAVYRILEDITEEEKEEIAAESAEETAEPTGEVSGEAVSEETGAEETTELTQEASEEAVSEETAAEENVSEETGAEETTELTQEAPEETVSEETAVEETGAEDTMELTKEAAGSTVSEAIGAETTAELTETVAVEAPEKVTEDIYEEVSEEVSDGVSGTDTEDADEPAPIPYEPREIKVVLTAEEDADIRENIFRYCVEHELTLLGLKTLSRTLEDVYLELTEGRRERAF